MHGRKKVTKDQYQEVMVALSQSAIKKSREAPPGIEITMTSYSVGNKTSLSLETTHPR